MINKEIKKLYLSGLSISDVAKKVGRSPTGVRYILSKEFVKVRSISDGVRIKHHKRLNSYTSVVLEKIPKELEKLYYIGLALYWGEGSKSGNTVAITNSDPYLIRVFLDFLRKICKVDEKRLHLLIHYHSDQNERELINYWSKFTKINKDQFYTSTLHNGKSEGSTNRLKFGTISLRYADSILLKDILDRINKVRIKG